MFERKSIMVLLLWSLGCCLGEQPAAAAVAGESEVTENCSTKYLELTIDIMPEQPPSCNVTEMVELQNLLSHVLDERFEVYKEKTKGIADIKLNGMCPTSLGTIGAGSNRALQTLGGFIFVGGTNSIHCPIDDGDTAPVNKSTLRKRKTSSVITAEDQINTLKKVLERQLGRVLTKMVNDNPDSCLGRSGVSSTVAVDIDPVDQPPTFSCVVF